MDLRVDESPFMRTNSWHCSDEREALSTGAFVRQQTLESTVSFDLERGIDARDSTHRTPSGELLTVAVDNDDEDEEEDTESEDESSGEGEESEEESDLDGSLSEGSGLSSCTSSSGEDMA